MKPSSNRRIGRTAALGAASIALLTGAITPALASTTAAPAQPNGTWDRAATTETNTTATWSDVPNATYYLCDGVATFNTTCSHESAPDTIHRFHIKACNTDGCSTTEIINTATNPTAPTKVRVKRIKQAEAGGDRCARIVWNKTAASNHYWVDVTNVGDNAVEGAAYKKANRATVCHLNPTDTYSFAVRGVNRLTKNVIGSQNVSGENTPANRTVGAVPGVPGKTTLTPLDGDEANPLGVGFTASIPAAVTGATSYGFQIIGQALDNTATGLKKNITGLTWNSTYQAHTKACNADGCSAYGTNSDKERTAPGPQFWNVDSTSSGVATFTTQGMRGDGGYSYRIKYCDRTKNSGCDPSSQADGMTGWITERNADSRNISGLKSGDKYAFMVVTSATTDGGSPKTVSTTKTTNIK